jgi:hypothetical protein
MAFLFLSSSRVWASCPVPLVVACFFPWSSCGIRVARFLFERRQREGVVEGNEASETCRENDAPVPGGDHDARPRESQCGPT